MFSKSHLATLVRAHLQQSTAGLPDGIFTNQKIPIREVFGGRCNGCWYILCPLVYFTAILWLFGSFRPFGIFCGHWVKFPSIWYILWPFGKVSVHLVYFVAIW
jgi:hypothetical protein